MKTLLFTLILAISAHQHGMAQKQPGRSSISINSAWHFYKGELPTPFDDEVEWKAVSLPHTWNDQDVVDEEDGYYRGVGWYRRVLTVDPDWKEKQIFLHFEAANQEVEVFVNQQKAGAHIGGYTAFTIPVTDYLDLSKGSENQVYVRVNNRYQEDIPTLTADFTFYGGIYRDVRLIITESVHFELEEYGAGGLYVSTPEVSSKRAQVVVKGMLRNDNPGSQRVTVKTRILDAAYELVKEVKDQLTIHGRDSLRQVFTLADPALWSPEDPYLYTVHSQVLDRKTGKLLDEMYSPLGLRWFSFDAEKGFFLNGKHYKLIGTNRHQDYQGIGNALPDALHVKDVEILKEMGGNFLRIAHYPQDPAVLQACDRLGIVASVEIPIVNRITESERFAVNSKYMMKEMIRQNFNHPSVVIWAYMNEVLLRPRYRDDPERQAIYFENIANLAQGLENIARAEDPYRYTMIPNHGAFDRYNEVGLTRIPMIVGWNLYQGWYGSRIEGFEDFLDNHRRQLPDKPLIITEYGAGADPRLRSANPKRFDFTVEYQNFYHYYYMKEILKRPFVAGVNVWNQNDFNSEGRIDAVPHINNKGLLTWDRRPKDAFYLYQAILAEEPYVSIGPKIWSQRTGIEDRDNIGRCTQSVEVYSNGEQVELFLNEESLGTREVSDFRVMFEVPFRDGENRLKAVSMANGSLAEDYHQIRFELIPVNFKSTSTPFEQIRISLGDHRYFMDDVTGEIWLPQKTYEQGNWGLTGDSIGVLTTKLDILGTVNDPLYQTQLVNPEGIKFDVPKGRYELTLHFAELETDIRKEQVYNLGNELEENTKGDARVFDVYVNGQVVLKHLNPGKQYGELRAIAHKIPVDHLSGEGIEVTFKAYSNAPVLNAIELKRIY